MPIVCAEEVTVSEVKRPQHLFIVRIWQEPSRAAPPGQWRGMVEHVPAGQRLYFSSLGDLVDFITCRLHRTPGGRQRNECPCP